MPDQDGNLILADANAPLAGYEREALARLEVLGTTRVAGVSNRFILYADADRGGTSVIHEGELGLSSTQTLISRIEYEPDAGSQQRLGLNDNDNPEVLSLAEYLGPDGPGNDLFVFLQTSPTEFEFLPIDSNYGSNIATNFVLLQTFDHGDFRALLTSLDTAGQRYNFGLVRPPPNRDAAASLSSGAPAITATGEAEAVTNRDAAAALATGAAAITATGEAFSPPATVTGSTVISTPGFDEAATPAGPDTYGLGEHIEIEVVFSGAVDVTGTPTYPLNLGQSPSGSPEQADYNRGSGTDTLVFRWTVSATDEDTNGVFFYRNRSEANIQLPGGATIRNAGTTTDADLELDASGVVSGTQSGHRVDGSLVFNRDGAAALATGLPAIAAAAEAQAVTNRDAASALATGEPAVAATAEAAAIANRDARAALASGEPAVAASAEAQVVTNRDASAALATGEPAIAATGEADAVTTRNASAALATGEPAVAATGEAAAFPNRDAAAALATGAPAVAATGEASAPPLALDGFVTPDGHRIVFAALIEAQVEGETRYRYDGPGNTDNRGTLVEGNTELVAGLEIEWVRAAAARVVLNRRTGSGAFADYLEDGGSLHDGVFHIQDTAGVTSVSVADISAADIGGGFVNVRTNIASGLAFWNRVNGLADEDRFILAMTELDTETNRDAAATLSTGAPAIAAAAEAAAVPDRDAAATLATGAPAVTATAEAAAVTNRDAAAALSSGTPAVTASGEAAAFPNRDGAAALVTGAPAISATGEAQDINRDGAAALATGAPVVAATADTEVPPQAGTDQTVALGVPSYFDTEIIEFGGIFFGGDALTGLPIDDDLLDLANPGAQQGYLKGFGASRGNGFNIRTSLVDAGTGSDVGPHLSQLVENNPEAFTLSAAHGDFTFGGPTSPGSGISDTTEPYTWTRPSAVYDDLETWLSAYAGGAVEFTIRDGSAATNRDAAVALATGEPAVSATADAVIVPNRDAAAALATGEPAIAATGEGSAVPNLDAAVALATGEPAISATAQGGTVTDRDAAAALASGAPAVAAAADTIEVTAPLELAGVFLTPGDGILDVLLEEADADGAPVIYEYSLDGVNWTTLTLSP